MITDFDDFCTWMYIIIDDIWKQIAPIFKRPGPAPVCSDSATRNTNYPEQFGGSSTQFVRSLRQSTVN
jgi:hypothetical protein